MAHGSILTERIICGKHGYYTKAAIEERRWINELIKEANQVTSEMCG